MKLTQSLGIKYPIIQAPMAGSTTPELIAASAEAGILGSVGAGYFSADKTRAFIREVKELTNEVFAVNLFIPEQVEVDENQIQKASEALQPIRQELGITLSEVAFATSEFAAQIQVLIEENVKVCSFTFGLPDEKTVRLLKENDVFLIGTATTVEEAVLAEQAGLDAVVAQGSEAGGHRGSFSGELTFIPLHELLTEVVKAVSIPVIAAGGIANKIQMDHTLSTGAQAVQIGTALLASEESGAHALHKKALLNAEEGCTEITVAFSGKAARGIQNQFMEDLKMKDIAPYPYQNDLTKEIRQEASKQEKSGYMSLWAGESVHLTTGGKIKEIIKGFL